MATKADASRPQSVPSPSDGASGSVSKAQPVQTDNSLPGGASINRKKQKRRQKQQQQQQARQLSSHDALSSHDDLLDNPDLSNGALPETQNLPDPDVAAPSDNPSSTRFLEYQDPAPNHSADANPDLSALQAAVANSQQSSSKKKKKNKAAILQDLGPSISNDSANLADKSLAPPTSSRGESSLWDTNGPEERSRIKAFWLNLTENERRDLVNIEKSHVLQKMKEQQKHSCSCSVCGRKRTAIEEELETLLKDPRIWADPTTNPPTDRLPASSSALTGPSRHRHHHNHHHHHHHHHHEFSDDQDEDDYPDDDDPADYSDDYDDEDEDYSDDDDIPDNVASDFLQFGNSLTVKDGILTVADDLLKNDGQKFIDMMEQLAERRMQREEDAHYSSAHGYPHGSLSPPHGANHLGEPPIEDDEYEDEEDDYDDEVDLEYDDEDEEDMDTLTEDQRMEEGRRMFQIFAARMFEQRVVTAYREKVAYERQQALIDEQEQDAVGTSEAKKSKNAEKKKRQRQAAKEAKAAKEAAKEEEKQRKETAARAAEEKKKEEQRLKQEEQRKKKEAEKKAVEDKKRKKEAEAQKRLEADRERQQELERKNREQKAEEKRRREEAEQKKRDDKEAREREARDKRSQEEAEQKGREDKAKAEKEAQERKQKADQEALAAEAATTAAAAPAAATTAAESAQISRTTSFDTARRPPPPTAVAVPPTLRPRASQTSHESPSAKIATPALPKAPTPSRVRDTPSAQPLEPRTPERTPQSRSSTSPKGSVPQSVQPPGMPPTRQHPMPMSQGPQGPSMLPGIPPPGSSHLPPTGQPFGGLPFGVNGLPSGSGQMPPSMMQRALPSQQTSMFQSQGAPQSAGTQPLRAGSHATGLPTPGTRAAFGDVTSGNFSQQLPASNQPLYSPPQRDVPPVGMPHTRQLSNQFEGLTLDTQSAQQSSAPQPIGRPAPTKRPSSVNKSDNRSSQDRPKSLSRSRDVDDLSSHLGSSALLDDSDEPLPNPNSETTRRPSAAPGSVRSSSSVMGSPFDYLTSPFASAGRAPGETWTRTPAMHYGAPGMPPPSHSQASSVWGGLDMNSSSHGWGSAPGASANTNAFGMPSNHRSAGGGSGRGVTVRMFTVQACKSLASQSLGVENSGYFDISDVVRMTVESGRQMHITPGIQLSEIRNILDTEGDANNGGGTFQLRTMEPKGNMSNRTLVRWVPEQTLQEPFVRQSPFYHQHPPQQHQQSLQSENLQGAFGQGPVGGASGQRQGLGLGEIGGPASDARLPNLGGLGRF